MAIPFINFELIETFLKFSKQNFIRKLNEIGSLKSNFLSSKSLPSQFFQLAS